MARGVPRGIDGDANAAHLRFMQEATAIAASNVVRSAVIAAAYARAPRKRPTPPARVSRNNYVAEPRRRAGAPLGNRNALRHGRYCRRNLARRRVIGQMIRGVRANIALRKLAKLGVPGLLRAAQINEALSLRAYWMLAASFETPD